MLHRMLVLLYTAVWFLALAWNDCGVPCGRIDECLLNGADD
jgi:hypothetical protein